MMLRNVQQRIFSTCFLFVFSIVVISPALASTVTWLKVVSAHSPSARSSMAMAYDAAGKKIVLFGGFDTTGYKNDTWVWDGQDWRQVFSPSNPSPRAASAMAYDRVAKKLVMFGGYNGSSYLGDTWVWDGISETWSEASPRTLPTAVTLPMLFTDPKTGHAAMFGGFDGQFYQMTTWRWSGSNWNDVHPANVPSARGAAIVANDFAHNNVVIYGGLADVNPLNTWTWDGTTWTKQNPTAQPLSTFYTPAAFDPMLGEVVMFSGPTGLNDTWAWNGTDWTTVTVVNAPPARESSGMAYDNDSNQLVVFGGDVPQGVMGDMYKLVKRQ